MRVAWKKKWGSTPILLTIGFLSLVGVFAAQVISSAKSNSHHVEAELSKLSQTLRAAAQTSKYALTESDRSLLEKQGLLKSATSPALKSLLQ